MANCNNCIHDKICPTWNYQYDCFAERDADNCKHYFPAIDIVNNVGVRYMEDEIYPLTITADRYAGVYSGGQFIAWNLKTDEVPKATYSDDCGCHDFWADNAIVCGKGRTVGEAIADLYIKLKGAKCGKWIATKVSERDYDGSYSNYTEYTCSECKRDNGMKQTNYCPNCGAKMNGNDGEENENL